MARGQICASRSESFCVNVRLVKFPFGVAVPGSADFGHAAAGDPSVGPGLEVFVRGTFESAHKIAPLGVAVKMLAIEAQAVAKVFVADQVRELFEQSRRLGIDDGAVGGFGVFQVADALIDGRGAERDVDAVSSGLDLLIEMRPDVLAGFEVGESAIGHVLREAFFEPKIVKPAHGGEIAEPLVGEFVKDQSVAAEAIVFRRGRPEEDAIFIEKRGARVLHAAEGEAGEEDHVVFRERERLREIAAEEFDAIGRGFLDGGNFGLGAGELGAADVHVGEAVDMVYRLERADGKGEEIGADGFSFGESSFTDHAHRFIERRDCVANQGFACMVGQGQRESSFEVR